MLGGPGPFDPITMGGLFTVLKVRDRPTAGDADSWYRHPKGTVAYAVSGQAPLAERQPPAKDDGRPMNVRKPAGHKH